MANQVKLKRPVAKKNVPAARSKKASDPTVLTYRALMPLQVATVQGKIEKRVYGDFVPEAATWPKIGIWLKTNQIEKVYVNQSDIDAWRERYDEENEEEIQAQKDEELRQKRLAELREEMAALQGSAPQARVVPDFNAAPKNREIPNEQTVQEPIDFSQVQDLGGVKFSGSGPAEVPRTRAPQVPANTAENRTRPKTVRRAVRKKV